LTLYRLNNTWLSWWTLWRHWDLNYQL
jgi:hypothetical protein